jgi:hypothetical protein
LPACLNCQPFWICNSIVFIMSNQLLISSPKQK